MQQLKVYYLDDEPELCEIFSDQFSSAEIVITTFTDPQKAIDATRVSPPNVMFLDYRLPGITGDLVAMEIAEIIPKFLVTGDITVKSSYQFHGVLSKPFDLKGTQDALNLFLKK